MPTHHPFIHSGASLAFQTQAEPDSFNHRGWGEVVTHLQKLGFGFREPSKVSNCPVFGSGAESLKLGPKATHTKDMQHLHKGMLPTSPV